ncbi:NnrS family protein [Thalassotalea atypica]|uniref:NnrS family protein n=1 Tax=Thalassotalea atypica TaxID=2054316 RepID=UPI0025727399|nr:NnrS family protein [Thalassotalea atypica]
MNINPRSTTPVPPAILELAFRPFFLLGALFSVIALIMWSLLLNGSISTAIYGGSLWWHIHEMLFSFATAIITGFLLTAVQNWTGVPSISGKKLMWLVLLWLSARVLFFMPALVPQWFIAVIDVSFLPAVAIALGYPIVKVKLWRNLMFIPILLAMASTNIAMHVAAINNDPMLMSNASTAMVLMVTLVMTIMGGRVFPMFTANGTQTSRVATIEWLDTTTITSTVFVIFITLGVIDISGAIKAILLFSCAFFHIIRVARWKVWVTLRTPLVWSLHFSYWCIPIGLIIFGLSEISPMFTHSQAIHTLTVGAMGSMILSMISRVSLGHTGRQIIVGKAMTFALVAIIFSFVVRVFGGYWLEDYMEVINTAVFFWVVGYGSFFVLYLPILTKPRV